MALGSRLDRLEQRLAKAELRQTEALPTFPQYRDDPLGYISDVLRVTLSPDLQDGTRDLLTYRKVLASSGHSVGKSHWAACLLNWFHDTRFPGVVLTTAPTDRQVKDILWKEVREQRRRAKLPDHWGGPKIPRLETSPAHFAHGFTARDATGFQGQHSPGGLLIIFDEAEGVEVEFWQALRTMLDDDSYFLAIYNPTTPGSAAHIAEQQADEFGLFRRRTISCLSHPNVAAGIRGEPKPIPGAITLGQLREMLLEDSRVLAPGDKEEPGDVTLNGERFRPGPVAEARCLGRRPSTGVAALWSEVLWKMVKATLHQVNPLWPVVGGCDVARFGDDQTCLMVRKGYALLHCEIHSKIDTREIAHRMKVLSETYADRDHPPEKIPWNVDEGGPGGGVIDQRGRFLFLPVNASCKPREEHQYENLRAELWFNGQKSALAGCIDVSRLAPQHQQRLWRELSVVKYQYNPKHGKKRVESKDDIKARLGRSPDVADAFNLTLYPPKVT